MSRNHSRRTHRLMTRQYWKLEEKLLQFKLIRRSETFRTNLSPSSPPSCPHLLVADFFPTAKSSSSLERLLHCQYQDEFSTCYAGFIFFPLSRIDFIFKNEITRWEANLIS